MSKKNNTLTKKEAKNTLLGDPLTVISVAERGVSLYPLIKDLVIEYVNGSSREIDAVAATIWIENRFKGGLKWYPNLVQNVNAAMRSQGYRIDEERGVWRIGPSEVRKKSKRYSLVLKSRQLQTMSLRNLRRIRDQVDHEIERRQKR